MSSIQHIEIFKKTGSTLYVFDKELGRHTAKLTQQGLNKEELIREYLKGLKLWNTK